MSLYRLTSWLQPDYAHLTESANLRETPSVDSAQGPLMRMRGLADWPQSQSKH